MAIEGPLKELGIHDVFQLLDLNRKTGVLTITSKLRHNRGRVYFDSGAIVYASIDTNPHPLGTVLLRAGKISDADLQRARDMQQAGDERRLGEILVAIGGVTGRELERHVRFQVEEVVFEVLSWREGYFSFVEGPLAEIPADATVRVSTETVLMEGARRIDEWSRIEPHIPHLGVVPVLAPIEGSNQGQVDLLPTEWEVLAAIDGDRDLRTIARGLGRSDFDVAKTVFGLKSAGIVTFQHAGAGGDGRGADGGLAELEQRAVEAFTSDDLEAARDFVDRTRSAYPGHPVVLVLVGRLRLAEDRPVEAEESLRNALRLDPQIAPAHRLLGDALARQGRLEEAAEWWGRWLRMGPHADEEAEEVERVQQAMRAAETLGTFLRKTHA